MVTSAREALEQCDEILSPKATSAAELDELLHSLDDLGALRRAGHTYATTAPHFEEALIPQKVQRLEDRVRIDAQDGGKVLRLRHSLAGLGFSVEDGTAQLDRDLFVQKRRIAAIDCRKTQTRLLGGERWPMASHHNASESRFIMLHGQDGAAAQVVHSPGGQRRQRTPATFTCPRR